MLTKNLPERAPRRQLWYKLEACIAKLRRMQLGQAPGEKHPLKPEPG